jgi:formylglycine-generating enzyme required for sulfatase activity
MSHCLCLACNTPNAITDKFCTGCGARLLIQDRYRALQVIGQGGFGKTFLAQDEGKPSKPRCVIKQFTYDDPATLAEATRLFEQEAVRLEQLGKHPQIPELLAHCEQQGRQYLVQEFIDGENLLHELRQSAFTEAQIMAVLGDLLPVLQFIHGGQVIHRDIKPENIIRRRSDGKLVLVDFGAAKLATQTILQKTGTIIGSPEYAAPEQTRGKATFASDVYGLGVTCIHLLTGCEPNLLFSDYEDQWVWRQFLNGKVVSANLGQVLDRMLAKALNRRYPSATDALTDLNSAPVPPPKPAPQPAVSSSVSVKVPQQSTQPPISPSPVPQTSWFGKLFNSGTTTALTLDCGNGIKLELVKIPAGSFMMGSNDGDDDEKPIHRVNVPEFLMGKYQVTKAQYEAVMGKNPSHFKGKQNPVEQLSWEDAQEFCKKLSQKTGRKVKLPSEAQWEYACRAGNTGKYCFGDNVDQLGKYAWYDGNSNSKTHPVGEKLANAWGLHDMHGNVWEWCEDVWHDSYNGAPSDGSAWISGGDQSRRALRGGSWIDLGIDCRSADRDRDLAVDRYGFIGFRVVV